MHIFNFVPELDPFALYLNAQVPCYVSRFPEPNAVANGAFSGSWEKKQFYAFPPFNLKGGTTPNIWRD